MLGLCVVPPSITGPGVEYRVEEMVVSGDTLAGEAGGFIKEELCGSSYHAQLCCALLSHTLDLWVLGYSSEVLLRSLDIQGSLRSHL